MNCIKQDGIANLIEYKAYERSLSVKKAIAAPSLINVINQLGEAEAMKLLYAIVDEGIRPFKVTNKMDQRDIITFCSDFIDIRGTETIEDLIICLKEARQGLYGQIYNRIDAAVLNDWFVKYLDKKLDEREAQIDNEKYMRGEEVGAISEFGQEVIDSIKNRIAKIQEEKKANLNKELIKPNSLELWFKNFETYAPQMDKEALLEVRDGLINSNKPGDKSKYINFIDLLIAKK